MQALSTHRVGHRATPREHKRAGAPIDPWWIVSILRRSYLPLAAATLSGLAIGAILAYAFVPSRWQAEAVVVPDVEPDPAHPFASDDALSEGASADRALIEQIVSEATLLKWVLQLLHALAQWERTAIDQLLAQPTLHVDETSLRVERKNHWIHICSGGDVTLKFLHPKRGLEAITAINIIPRY